MWLRQAYKTIKRVLGKVRSGVEKGTALFNKGKEMYASAKAFASNLPFVGDTASDLINRLEVDANQYAKRKIGVDFNDVNRAVSMADVASKYLPSSR